MTTINSSLVDLSDLDLASVLEIVQNSDDSVIANALQRIGGTPDVARFTSA